MSSNIFINYRKDDGRWYAHALYKELQKYFSKNSIFKDFNNIELGEDFVESINKALEYCSILIVVIGKNWLNVKDKTGSLRLTEPNDYVKLEIITALKRNIRIIPVLFDNAEMPSEDQLSEDLKPLSRRQFISVSDTKFESDIEKLAVVIKRIIEPGKAHVRDEEAKNINRKKDVGNLGDVIKKNKNKILKIVTITILIIDIIAYLSKMGDIGNSNDETIIHGIVAGIFSAGILIIVLLQKINTTTSKIIKWIMLILLISLYLFFIYGSLGMFLVSPEAFS